MFVVHQIAFYVLGDDAVVSYSEFMKFELRSNGLRLDQRAMNFDQFGRWTNPYRTPCQYSRILIVYIVDY